MSRTDLHTLLIEDDEDFVSLLRALANQDDQVRLTFDHATSLREGLSTEGDFDLVLLDLELPDASGLAGVRKMVDAVSCPIVVLTGRADIDVATEALQLGVQEYLLKQDVNGPLLLRTARYAVDRQRLAAEVDAARQAEARERELRRVERIAATTTSVTASSLGVGSLQERRPPLFRELVAEYVRILDEAVEQRSYRVSPWADPDLQSLATVLGAHGATPRDVIEVHTAALVEVLQRGDRTRQQAAAEEARLVVLRLMGNLVSHYRARAVGHPTRPTTEGEEPT